MGVYLKANEILHSINRIELSENLKRDYFNSMALLYGGFYEYVNGLEFSKKHLKFSLLCPKRV